MHAQETAQSLAPCPPTPTFTPPGFGGAGGHDVSTAGLIKSLGEHIGRPLELRVVRPGATGTPLTLRVTAVEAPSPHA